MSVYGLDSQEWWPVYKLGIIDAEDPDWDDTINLTDEEHAAYQAMLAEFIKWQTRFQIAAEGEIKFIPAGSRD